MAARPRGPVRLQLQGPVRPRPREPARLRYEQAAGSFWPDSCKGLCRIPSSIGFQGSPHGGPDPFPNADPLQPACRRVLRQPSGETGQRPSSLSYNSTPCGACRRRRFAALRRVAGETTVRLVLRKGPGIRLSASCPRNRSLAGTAPVPRHRRPTILAPAGPHRPSVRQSSAVFLASTKSPAGTRASQGMLPKTNHQHFRVP